MKLTIIFIFIVYFDRFKLDPVWTYYSADRAFGSNREPPNIRGWYTVTTTAQSCLWTQNTWLNSTCLGWISWNTKCKTTSTTTMLGTGMNQDKDKVNNYSLLDSDTRAPIDDRTSGKPCRRYYFFYFN